MSLDLGLVAAVLLASVNFNTAALRTADIAPLLRTALQAIVIGFAVGSAVFHPTALRAAEQSAPTKWLAAFCVLAVLSTLWSVDPGRTVSQSLSLLAMVTLVVVHSRQLTWERTRRVVATSLLGVLAFGAALEILVVRESERWAGVTGSATQLAQLSVLAAAVVVAGHLSGRVEPPLIIVVMFGCIGLVAMSQSRVALVVVGILILTTLWLHFGRATRSLLAVGAVAAAMVVVFAVDDLLAELALRDDTDVGELTELTGRSRIWPRALDLILDRLWLGRGFASGEQIWAAEVMAGRANWYPSNAHQILLEAALSLGLVGFALLLTVGISVIAAAARAGRAGIGSAILVLTVAALGVTEAMVHFASPAFVVIALATTALSNGRQTMAVDRRRSPLDRIPDPNLLRTKSQR